MACCVDRFRPIVGWSLVLIQHCSCGFYESSILPLHNTILLSIWNRKLMLDSFFIKKLFNVGVLELHPVVTSNSLDFDIKLILGSSCKLLEDTQVKQE